MLVLHFSSNNADVFSVCGQEEENKENLKQINEAQIVP